MPCFVAGCKNIPTAGTILSYHRFPKDESLKKEWLRLIGKQNVQVNRQVVCSDHFTEDQFSGRIRKRLRANARPSQYLPLPATDVEEEQIEENGVEEQVEAHGEDSGEEEQVEQPKPEKRKWEKEEDEGPPIKRRAIVQRSHEIMNSVTENKTKVKTECIYLSETRDGNETKTCRSTLFNSQDKKDTSELIPINQTVKTEGNLVNVKVDSDDMDLLSMIDNHPSPIITEPLENLSCYDDHDDEMKVDISEITIGMSSVDQQDSDTKLDNKWELDMKVRDVSLQRIKLEEGTIPLVKNDWSHKAIDLENLMEIKSEKPDKTDIRTNCHIKISDYIFTNHNVKIEKNVSNVKPESEDMTLLSVDNNSPTALNYSLVSHSDQDGYGDEMKIDISDITVGGFLNDQEVCDSKCDNKKEINLHDVLVDERTKLDDASIQLVNDRRSDEHVECVPQDNFINTPHRNTNSKNSKRKKRDSADTVSKRICSKMYESPRDKTMFTVNRVLNELKLGSSKIYKCSECNKAFLAKSILDRHIQSNHKNDKSLSTNYKNDKTLLKPKTVAVSMYVCSKCDRIYSEKHHLDDHIVNEHKNTELPEMTESKMFDCTKCKEEFITKGALELHIINKHADDEDLLSSITSQIHKCPACSKQYIQKFMLDCHFLREHINSSTMSSTCHYECSLCCKHFHYKRHLDHHIVALHRDHENLMKTVTEEILECTKCDKLFCARYFYNKHLLKHEKDEDRHKMRLMAEKVRRKRKMHYKDESEDESSQDSDNKLLNMNSIKVFQCLKCDKQYNYQCGTLNVYNDVKNYFLKIISSRIYECFKCNKHCTHPAELDKHIVSEHNSERDLLKLPKRSQLTDMRRCPKCNVRYADKASLDRHILSGHAGDQTLFKVVTSNVIECPECQKLFTGKCYLDLHILRTHKNDRNLMKLATSNIYECFPCGQLFFAKVTLDKHTEAKHNFINKT